MAIEPEKAPETPADPSVAVECKHPGIKGTAWLSPWWVENTDWQPVTEK